MNRAPTSKGSLLRRGFADPDRAAEQLQRLGDAADPLLAILGRTADPDLALSGLVRLAEAADEGESCCRRSPTTRAPRCVCWRCWA